MGTDPFAEMTEQIVNALYGFQGVGARVGTE
jgi:hypothetical protein